MKREKIGGDKFTWIDLTAQTKAIKYERTLVGQIHLEDELLTNEPIVNGSFVDELRVDGPKSHVTLN